MPPPPCLVLSPPELNSSVGMGGADGQGAGNWGHILYMQSDKIESGSKLRTLCVSMSYIFKRLQIMIRLRDRKSLVNLYL